MDPGSWQDAYIEPTANRRDSDVAMSQWVSVNQESASPKDAGLAEAPVAGPVTSGTVEPSPDEVSEKSSSEEPGPSLSDSEEAHINALPSILRKSARRRANERVLGAAAAAGAAAGVVAVAPMGVDDADLQSLEEMDEQRQQKKAQLSRLDQQLAKKTADLQSVEVMGGLITALRSDSMRGMVETLTTAFRTGAESDDFPRLSDVQKRQVAATNYNGIVPLEADRRPCDRCVRRVVQRPDHKCVRTPSGCEYCVSKKKGCDFNASSPPCRSDGVLLANFGVVPASAQQRDEHVLRDCPSILQHYQYDQPPSPLAPLVGGLRPSREASSSAR